MTTSDVEARLRFAIPNTEVRNIVSDIARRFGQTGLDLIGPSRRAEIVEARHTAIYALRQAKPRFSLPRIGRIFGGRDPTTIRHALQKMERRGKPQASESIVRSTGGAA